MKVDVDEARRESPPGQLHHLSGLGSGLLRRKEGLYPPIRHQKGARSRLCVLRIQHQAVAEKSLRHGPDLSPSAEVSASSRTFV